MLEGHAFDSCEALSDYIFFRCAVLQLIFRHEQDNEKRILELDQTAISQF